MNGQVLVEVEGVSRFYGKTAAVADVSFLIRRGEVLGFLGPNGAGKTTTMQMLSGNLAPSRGRVSIAGCDLLENPTRAKRHIGYLPENPPLYRELTVDEFLDFCAALHGLSGKDRKAARERAKTRCGLTEVGRRLTGHLSKGYQQRTGLAQAIIHNPDVIILDEPTVGLDPIQMREIRSLIRELGREHAVILSTHILPEVRASCDRVQIINRGRLVLNESIQDLDRRMQSSVLAVTFRRPPAPEALAALPGVGAVTAEGETRFKLFHDPAADPTEALIKLATDKEWGIYEISPERQSLEALFVELTGQAGEA
ncbi:MAG: ATP-binding cassette domain-containing protein [Gammaproteobacteria bacterium]|nr:ATP-binding cassette domain-containing protein [Gammaproteobacteria bacterium]